MTCAGNATEYCGGPNRLNLYNYTQPLPTSPSSGGGGGGSGTTSSVSPVTSNLPGTWAYSGCYVDNANGRVLGNEYDNNNITVEACIANCASENYTIAGIEYSIQCCKLYHVSCLRLLIV